MSSNRSGFTLVEVVMAIVILSFGIVVLASTAAGISRMLDSGQGKTRAAALAASCATSSMRHAPRARAFDIN